MSRYVFCDLSHYILDSIKAIGGKTADLFKKDDTPDHIEEKAKVIVIDGEKKESDAVLFEFKKLSDAVHIDKELDDAQLYGDIKNPYPVDMPKVNYI